MWLLRYCMLVGAIVMAALASSPVSAQQHTVHVTVDTLGKTTNVNLRGDGTYSDVITEVLLLRQRGPEADQDVLAMITAGRNDLPPPYYLEATRRLCRVDATAALDWFGLYRIRARYDAARCSDTSAQGNVQGTLAALQFPECKDAMTDSASQIQSLKRVAAQTDLFQSNASPWWICSGGMGLVTQELEKAVGDQPAPPAVIEEMDWIRPSDEWPALAEQIRAALDAAIRKAEATQN